MMYSTNWLCVKSGRIMKKDGKKISLYPAQVEKFGFLLVRT